MKEAIFNFEPIALANLSRQKNRQNGVTINVRQGTIVLSKQYVEDNQLNGKYLKFFVDTKKFALGWSIMKQTSFFAELKEYKLVKINSAGVYLISIATAIKQFNFPKEIKTFKKMQIKKYLSAYNSIHTTIYYVTLKCNETKK